MFWLTIASQARKGSGEAREMLLQENEQRKAQSLPSVEQEMAETAREGQMPPGATGKIRPKQQPGTEVSDFGTMEKDELRDILTNGRVIWRRPGT